MAKRIQLTKYQFAELIDEVDGLCPLCTAELLTKQAGQPKATLAQAAHIYPHSPTTAELHILQGVPKLSENDESVENLIMLCPNCHSKFDHPRTREGYFKLYNLKRRLSKRRTANAYYEKYNIEEDIIAVLQSISNADVSVSSRKLSYSAMTVESKMNNRASPALKNAVIRDVRDFYIPIKEALVQIEQDRPGKSDMIAKEVSIFYSELKSNGLSQDEIYYAINDWIDAKTQRSFSLLTPYITAFYVQNCEVFS